MEAKKDMRARGVRSPDLGDAIALTFASLRYVPHVKHEPATEQEIKEVETSMYEEPALAHDTNLNLGPQGWML